MKKNDKLIVVGAVAILIIASIGIYTWVPTDEGIIGVASAEDIFDISGIFSDVPDAVTVSDSCPFYPLIATPLAIHYDADYQQEVIPLYVKNLDDPSRAIERVKDQIDARLNELIIDGSKSAKDVSLDIAQNCWESSDAVLIIEDNESGYDLGVIATPLASYLSIPVIVTDDMDQDVMAVLADLGVKYTIVCGEHIEGYGKVLKFNSVEEIVDVSIEFLLEKFGTIDYITITNPVDAWPPEVLASEEHTFTKTVTTGATTELMKCLTEGKNPTILGIFTIPEDYKYALVKFEGFNLESKNVDELGDAVGFSCGPKLDDIHRGLQNFEIYVGGTSDGGIPIRDSNGNIIVDKTYSEAVLYDRGGVEYEVRVQPAEWLATDRGDVRIDITVEKLSDPIYPMMKGLSSIAPYLTAYHKGILFGKSEFAFAADDDILYDGEPSPGFYIPRRNANLIEASNDHVFDIHEQINDVLAKIADIQLERKYDIKSLREFYKNKPIYMALVGGATVIPQLIYDSIIAPTDPEKANYYFGPGTPSDFIYGNVDPKIGDWSNQAPDLYSEYPFQENIVGRITGWDVQDAGALIVRTIFYNEIIDKMGDWKDNALTQLGGGSDFQKPFVRYKIFGEMLDMIKRGEPMKLETGASYFIGLAIQKTVLEPLEFNTKYIRENAATYQGFSNEAIDKLKKANLINKVLLSKLQLKKELGVGVVRGKELQENSNFIHIMGHGSQHLIALGDVGLWKLGFGLPNGIIERVLEQVVPIIGYGPGTALGKHGFYNTRNVENMDLGPSVLYIDSCICGKIDGVYPQQGIGQAYLHSGCNAVIAATTETNIPGGYLEPKNTKYDLPGQTLIRYSKAKSDAKKEIYPDLHFGSKIYQDLCKELGKNKDVSIGEALRGARNAYLPQDAEWKLWWAPPLFTTGDTNLDYEVMYKDLAASSDSGLDQRLDNKFVSFQEYTLYGDPAFVPYIPVNHNI